MVLNLFLNKYLKEPMKLKKALLNVNLTQKLQQVLPLRQWSNNHG